MTPQDPDPMSPDEVRVREALRALEPRRPDAAFRERLAGDFVSGRLGAQRVPESPVARHRQPGIGRWRIARLALAPLAVAALIVVVVVVDRGPGWSVLATTGEGVAVLDGSSVPLAHREGLARRLRPGARLTVPPGGEIELASAAGLVVQVTAGTEFTLPATPGRWFHRRIEGAVRRGEIRVTTGSAFRGSRLRVVTPEVAVEVAGTTLAVICEPVGTCVCVYDGEVRVGAHGQELEGVPTGRRRFVFNDGRPPETADIRPIENQKLEMLRAGRRGWLEGAGK